MMSIELSKKNPNSLKVYQNIKVLLEKKNKDETNRKNKIIEDQKMH